ncbi:23S rRNA (adenine(2503)-C(2))-methyltransferase RlmN [Deferribacter thermophilus]|uniref:23S rRNA (adenine(2503)-C(2))-methyltransferase RlmN n=1 Tax=Deferribacter thermophilus TaxID=53573 RepID=UPI003C28342D
MTYKIDNLSIKELQKFIIDLNEKPFRAKQLYKWIYQKGITSFEEMTDLPLNFRDKLSDIFEFTKITPIEQLLSKLDGSIKVLFELEDKNYIESVLMFDGERVTACVSTQVGCRMGCKFCNTAKIGLIRNLTSGEIIRQIIYLKDLARQNNKLLSNIVFMGMGEPLDNYENLTNSLDIILDEDGLNFSHRKVTVSTCGIIDKLYTLSKNYKVNIAISLNASSNKIRSKLMPINKKFNIEEIIKSIKNLPIPKRKRITIEYVLIDGINNTKRDANLLVKLLKGLPVKVNLIVYNKIKDSQFNPPDLNYALNFQKTLINNGVATFIRKSFGQDIEAACGQLYAKYYKERGLWKRSNLTQEIKQ